MTTQIQQYIIGFNGPPRVGKDTVASALATLLDQEATIPCHVDHLARPMRDEVLGQLGIDRTDFELYNRIKDQPQLLFSQQAYRTGETVRCASIREHMIAYSETFIKPRYGQDFWGRRLVSDHKWLAQGVPGILLVPDIGFRPEILAFENTKAHVLIVQLSRQDQASGEMMGWGNDSRRYCNGDISASCKLQNKSISDTAEEIHRICLEELGWNFR